MVLMKRIEFNTWNYMTRITLIFLCVCVIE